MEIKAKLLKPFTSEEKTRFIIEQNHRNGYEIKETAEALESWGATDEELLAQAKKAKYDEANNGAKAYLDSGNALFELEPTKHIEATDGNIGKLNAYITGFSSGVLEIAPWSTKEDEVIILDLELTTKILIGLMAEQTRVWTEKAPYFIKQIEEAKTIEEVLAIKIDYSIDFGELGEENENLQDNDESAVEDSTTDKTDEETVI